jgi:hypothetical protein
MIPRQMPGIKLVEAAGQLILYFRRGLDYTFIHFQDAGRVIQGVISHES